MLLMVIYILILHLKDIFIEIKEEIKYGKVAQICRDLYYRLIFHYNPFL